MITLPLWTINWVICGDLARTDLFKSKFKHFVLRSMYCDQIW